MDKIFTTQPLLTSAATLKLVNAAVAHAEQLQIAVNIAVVDTSGQLLASLRMQGAHSGAIDIAIDKAWTAASFGGRTTRDVAASLERMADVTRSTLIARLRYTGLPGALPIRVSGALLGAIGVSGATSEQDEACSAAALAAIGADPVPLPD